MNKVQSQGRFGKTGTLKNGVVALFNSGSDACLINSMRLTRIK